MRKPLPTHELGSGHHGAAVVAAAFEHDLFRPLLGGAALRADGIAAAVKAPLRFVEESLDCLVQLGAAVASRRGYRLSAAWRRWLNANYDESRARALASAEEVRRWFALGAVARGAARSQEDDMFSTGNGLERYLRGVLEFNRPMIEALTAVLLPRLAALPHPRVADVGGGHAGFVLALAAGHPGLEGEVLDLPATNEVSRRINAGSELMQRIRYVDADARRLEVRKRRFDVVMVNDLLHSFDREDKQTIIANALRLVEPGGLLAVTKFARSARDGRRDNAMFSMKLFVNTNGRGYLESDEELLEIVQGLGGRVLEAFGVQNKVGILFAVPGGEGWKG